MSASLGFKRRGLQLLPGPCSCELSFSLLPDISHRHGFLSLTGTSFGRTNPIARCLLQLSPLSCKANPVPTRTLYVCGDVHVPCMYRGGGRISPRRWVFRLDIPLGMLGRESSSSVPRVLVQGQRSTCGTLHEAPAQLSACHQRSQPRSQVRIALGPLKWANIARTLAWLLSNSDRQSRPAEGPGRLRLAMRGDQPSALAARS